MYKLVKKCRICKSSKLKTILDLGSQPPANSLRVKLTKQLLVPLNMLRCSECFTLQLSATVDPGYLFSKYLWVTGTSDGVKRYRNFFVKKIMNFHKTNKRKLLEIASNDGFFLEEFKKNKFTVLGVDPAKNIAKRANKKKIKTIPAFFNENTSELIKKKYFSADIVICRNVIPHVENIHSVIKGISKVLESDGKAYIEFHYAENLNKNLHYDYIYHEHIFYFTIKTMKNLLEKHNLYSIDYFKSPISGGSIVLVVSKKRQKISNSLQKLIKQEKSNKINSKIYWKNFKQKCLKHKLNLNKTLNKFLKKGNRLSGYGASARSSTLLNFCKINNKHLNFIFDKNKMKNNLYTAGSDILIKKPLKKEFQRINCVIILAWNFKDEIIQFLKKKVKFKGYIITVLPSVRITKC
jgi:ubiquinone/menaquinone biosynthesis C-methylase UbiE